MDSHTFESYLSRVQELTYRLDDQPATLQELLHFIELSKDQTILDHSYQEFFTGEYAYFSAHYERALKHYLQAKEISGFEFYCFLTSSQISKTKGSIDKAITFVEKALELKPNHYSALLLYSHLLSLSGRYLESEEVKNKAAAFACAYSNSHSDSPVQHETKAPVHLQNFKNIISENEINELAGMFLTQDRDRELFSSHPSEHQTSAMAPISFDLFSDKSESEINEYDGSRINNAPFKQLSEIQTSDSLNDGKLAETIKDFHQKQGQKLKDYLTRGKYSISENNHSLFMFQGWDEKGFEGNEKFTSTGDQNHSKWHFLRENGPESSQGFFIRWNGKGIAVNPGSGFLNHFHDSGHHIHDIDYVIVINNDPGLHLQIREIYDLNFQLNQVSDRPHFINYYLSHQSYQILSSILKPRYKQEKHAVHLLELYIDSEEEKIDLSEDIALHYFLIPVGAPFNTTVDMRHGDRHQQQHMKLGIRLKLNAIYDSLIDQELVADKVFTDQQNLGIGETSASNAREFRKDITNRDVTIGYVEGVKWTPSINSHFKGCDLMIASIGNTNEHDYQKFSYMEGDIGYFGALSLYEAILPKIMLCTNFGGKNGDIRLEFVKKLRGELQSMKLRSHSLNENHSGCILPGEIGLQVDLKSFLIKCGSSLEFICPKDIKVTRCAGPFSRLRYLPISTVL